MLGCERNSTEPEIFSQESDPVFRGAERRVVRPFSQNWVAYYYEHETVDSLAKKVARSDFFINEGWSSFHHLKKANVMSSGRGRQDAGKLSSIQVVPGKYFADPSGPESPIGATVVLLPRSRK